MHKVVLDTNVLVSALISTGFPNKLFHNIIAPKLAQLIVSEEVIKEYEDVLKYSKFGKHAEFAKNSEIILSHIKRIGKLHKPNIRLFVIKDIDDNKFLELAVSAKADFIITGNAKDFTFNEYERVRIISPKDYYNEFQL